MQSVWITLALDFFSLPAGGGDVVWIQCWRCVFRMFNIIAYGVVVWFFDFFFFKYPWSIFLFCAVSDIDKSSERSLLMNTCDGQRWLPCPQRRKWCFAVCFRFTLQWQFVQKRWVSNLMFTSVPLCSSTSLFFFFKSESSRIMRTSVEGRHCVKLLLRTELC